MNSENLKNGLVKFVNMQKWMLAPDYLQSLVLAFCEKSDSDYDKMVALLGGRDPQKDGYGYEIQNGIAVINIHQPTVKRADLEAWFWGFTGTEAVKIDIENALKDPAVNAILLDIDSPGGSVDGTKELSDLIFNSRNADKRIFAYTNGSMASAAYYYGSAADEIIATPISVIGSIGVYTVYMEMSRMLDKLGITVNVIKAGKEKAIGNPYESMTPEQRAVIQKEIDTFYEMFVADVARNRGVSIEAVIKDMADARIFIGGEAEKAGLTDKTGYIKDLIHIGFSQVTTLTNGGKMSLFTKDKSTVAEIEKEAPEIAAAFIDRGKAQVRAETDEAIKIAVSNAKKETEQAERSRAASIMALAAEDQKPLAMKLFADGKSIEEATKELLIDAQATKAAALDKFQKGAAAIVDHGAKETESVSAKYIERFEKDKDFAKLYERKGGKQALEAALVKWNGPKVREEFGGNVETYLAYARNSKEEVK